VADKIQLDIQVNTAPVKVAVTDLGNFKKSADDASKALDGLSGATEKTVTSTTKVATAAERMQVKVNAAQREMREMATAVGVLNGPLGGISGRLNSLSSLFDKVTPQMVGFTVAAIAITGAFAFMGPKIIASAQAYELLQARIKNSTAATGDYIGVSKALNDITQRTGVGLENQVASFGRLRLATQTLGKSNQDILTFQKTITELGVMSNLPDAKLKEVMNAMARGFTTGTLRGREFTSVLRNLPSVASLMAEKMGVSVLKLTELAKQGKISGVEGFEAVLQGADEVEAKMNGFPLSIARAKVAMENSFSQLAATIDQTFNISGNMSKFFVAMGHGMDFVREHIDEVIITLGAFTLVLAGLNFQGIVNALAATGNAFKVFGSLVSIESIQIGFKAALTSFSFKKMGADIVASTTQAGIAMERMAVNPLPIALDAITKTSTIATLSISNFAKACWETVLSEEAATAACVPLVNGLKGVAASAIVATEGVIGLGLAFLKNPMTWWIAGTLLVSEALLKLKKNVEENTKLTVSWGNVASGIWKATANIVSTSTTQMIQDYEKWYAEFYKGEQAHIAFGNMAKWAFDTAGQSIRENFPVLAQWVSKLGVIKDLMEGLGAAQRAYELSIGNEARQDQMTKYAQKLGVKVPDVNNDASMREFQTNKAVSANYKKIHKEGGDINLEIKSFLDGSGAVSDAEHTPLSPDKKADKAAISMAKKIAQFTEDMDRKLENATSLYKFTMTHSENESNLEALRTNAEDKVDGHHFKFTGNAGQQADKRNSLVDKEYKLSLIGQDEKLGIQAKGLAAKTEEVKKLTQAYGEDYDAIAKVTRANAVMDVFNKAKGTDKARQQLAIAAATEYDAQTNKYIAEHAKADKDAVEDQNKLNQARAIGVLALQQETLVQAARNQAESEYKSTGIHSEANIQNKASLNLVQGKMNSDSLYDANLAQIKQANQDTDLLTIAVKQGNEAYRKMAISIQAYNTALHDSNASTQEQKDALQAALIDEQEHQRQLSIATYHTQQMDQASQALAGTFTNFISNSISGTKSLSDSLKQLGMDILKIAEQELLLKPIQNILGGNAATGQKGALNWLMQAVSAGSSMAGAAGGSAAGATAFAGSVDFAAKIAPLALAHGGIFSHSGLVPFAKGGIVDSPHIFPFANGTGLMGEAGPEAIVPLKRMSNGALGIQQSGSGKGNSVGDTTIHNNVNVTVSSSGDSDKDNAMANEHAKQISMQLKAAVADQIREQQRSGNMLSAGASE
jgi:tape measure domain-containing protein